MCLQCYCTNTSDYCSTGLAASYSAHGLAVTSYQIIQDCMKWDARDVSAKRPPPAAAAASAAGHQQLSNRNVNNVLTLSTFNPALASCVNPLTLNRNDYTLRLMVPTTLYRQNALYRSRVAIKVTGASRETAAGTVSRGLANRQPLSRWFTYRTLVGPTVSPEAAQCRGSWCVSSPCGHTSCYKPTWGLLGLFNGTEFLLR